MVTAGLAEQGNIIWLTRYSAKPCIWGKTMDQKAEASYDRTICPILCDLRVITLSDVTIRYLNLQEGSFVDLCGEICSTEESIPLFLAKDVFKECNLTQNNVQRIHARFSKDGKATKLLCSDFRINGLNQNRLWFYTIQGLLEVIFHYHGTDVQKECLKQLTVTFLSHCDDSSLPEGMTVSLNEESADVKLRKEYPMVKGIKTTNENLTLQRNSSQKRLKNAEWASQSICGSNSQSSVPDDYQKRQKRMKLTTLYNDQCSLCSSRYTENSLHYSVCYASKEGTRKGIQVRSIAIQTELCVLQPLKTITSVSTQTESIKQDGNGMNESDFDTAVDCRSAKVNVNLMTVNNKQYEQVTKEILSKDNDLNAKSTCPYCLYLSRASETQNQDLTNCLIKLNQFILFEYSEHQDDFAAWFYSIVSLLLDHYPNRIFPRDFISNFLHELQQCNLASEGKHSWDLFINFLCRYVGKELHKFEDEILQNLHQFKEDHIKCIDNLPPPEQIIDSIFPSCMKELIFYWMSPKSCDHSSSNQMLYDEISIPDYHVIQLVLEFVNNALISGVAHVVYSRVKSLNG